VRAPRMRIVAAPPTAGATAWAGCSAKAVGGMGFGAVLTLIGVP
jgi:hypothetical protein